MLRKMFVEVATRAVTVVTSDLPGLGKTQKIAQLAFESGRRYEHNYYFKVTYL